MTQPTVPVLQYNFQSELGSSFGTHLDSNFDDLVASTTEIIAALALIQRDDGRIRNAAVTPDALSSETLTLIAGSATNPAGVEWKPLGTWVTSTLYKVGNIVESSAFNFMCVVEHTSGVFITDLVAGKWQQMTVLQALQSSDITGALGYTPVNKAGDTMTGALVIPTGSKILGASGITWTDTLMASQDLATVNKGIYSVYESSKNDIVYGFASNVVRAAGAFLTVGGQFSAFGTSSAGAAVFGGNINAIALSGFGPQAMIGLEIDIASFTPNNTAVKVGLDMVFADRANSGGVAGNYSYTFPQGTYTSAGGGLGNNRYNYRSRAFSVSSQARSSTGEYCGWTRGLFFNEFSLDSENDASFPGSRAYPIAIDLSELHYYGGSDPVTAYNLEAAIALRDLQGIWWNRDPASASTAGVSKIRSHFNPFTLRWVIENSGTERFGVDVTTGTIYTNGVALGAGVSASGNNTWTGTNTFNNTVTIGSNLTFSGLARRITGDFTNATIANRLIFQTSTLNSETEVMAMPNGTSTTAAYNAISTSGAATGTVLRMAIDAVTATIQSVGFGGGAALPLAISVGSEAARFDINRALLINTTSSPTNGSKLRVNGLVQIDNTAAFAVNLAGVGFNCADATVTQVPFSTEDFDVGSYYNLGTQRFTPPAGKYMLCGAARTDAVGVDQGVFVAIVYKNGAQHKSGNFSTESGTGSFGSTVTCVVDANGTDYFDLRVFQDNGTATTLAVSGLATDTYFQGFRIG